MYQEYAKSRPRGRVQSETAGGGPSRPTVRELLYLARHAAVIIFIFFGIHRRKIKSSSQNVTKCMHCVLKALFHGTQTKEPLLSYPITRNRII
jgi:hypothetical protein